MECLCRERELDAIKQSIESGISCFISGPPKIGKTTLFGHVSSSAFEGCLPGEYMIIQTDINDYVSTHSAVFNYEFFKYLFVANKEKIKNKLNTSYPNVFAANSMSPIFFMLKDISQQVMKLVIIVDNFDLILSDSYGIGFFSQIGKIQKDFENVWIFFSSENIDKFVLKKGERVHKLRDFIKFNELNLSIFTNSETVKYLEEKYPSADFDIDTIQKWTGNHPYLLNLLPQKIMKDNKFRPGMDIDLILKRIFKEDKEINEFLDDYWCELNNNEKNFLINNSDKKFIAQKDIDKAKENDIDTDRLYQMGYLNKLNTVKGFIGNRKVDSLEKGSRDKKPYNKKEDDESIYKSILAERFGYSKYNLHRKLNQLTDPEVSKILKRDIKIAVLCLYRELWKPCVIMCGGIIEGFLYDKLNCFSKTQLKQAYKKKYPNKKSKNLSDYRLHDSIEIAVEFNILEDATGKMSHGLRDYRNYIHPQKEVREPHAITERDANIACQFIFKLLDEL